MIEGKETKTKKGVLRFGMVGGASGSFIADVHCKAARSMGKRNWQQVFLLQV